MKRVLAQAGIMSRTRREQHEVGSLTRLLLLDVAADLGSDVAGSRDVLVFHEDQEVRFPVDGPQRAKQEAAFHNHGLATAQTSLNDPSKLVGSPFKGVAAAGSVIIDVKDRSFDLPGQPGRQGGRA